MTRLLSGTRYLIIVPIVGLAIAAAVFFVIGGLGLIALIVERFLGALGTVAMEAHQAESLPIEVEIVEYVHTFLIGTVLYITAVGFYQLFINDIPLHGWLHIESTEELETNLIGVTVVVLAVNFMGFVFTGNTGAMLQYGGGIALPIAALALFVGLRSWANRTGDPQEPVETKPEQAQPRTRSTAKAIDASNPAAQDS